MITKALREPGRGFTLVELLVVMAVIMILAAVILPVTMQVRNRARGATCISHLRQLGQAAGMYASDNEGRLPRAPGSPFAGSLPDADHPGGTASSYACAAMESYLGSRAITRCPNDRGAPPFGFGLGTEIYRESGTSYLWNMARRKQTWVLNGTSLARDGTRPLFRDYGSQWHGTRIREGMRVVEEAQAYTVYADGHAAPEPAFLYHTTGGSYTASVTRGPEFDSLTVAGTTEYGSALAYGESRPGEPGAGQVVVTVYATIYTGDGVQDASRTFTFSGRSDSVQILRQIIQWIESLIGQ